MNNEQLFGIIIMSKLRNVAKLIRTGRKGKVLDNEYLWKVLFTRNYEHKKEFPQYYSSYEIEYNFAKVFYKHIMFPEWDIFASPENLYEMEKISGYENKEDGLMAGNYHNIELISFTKRLKYLVNLRLLRIYSESITSIPPYISDFTSLKTLIINMKYIKAILPNEISLMTNLREFHLEDTNFKKVPTFIFKMKYLEHLSINDGSIKKLKSKLLLLSNLISLDMSNNRIGSIPANIKKLQHLERLILMKNCIRTVHNNLFKMNKLNRVVLYDNKYNLTSIIKMSPKPNILQF